MTEGELERLNTLLQSGMARHLAFAVIAGQADEDEAWAEHAVNMRGYQLAALPSKGWPAPPLAWDVDPARWHLAMDGMKADAFIEAYPDVGMYQIDRAELQAVLATIAQRIADPLSESYRSKTARLVAHLESGGHVTPSFVVYTKAGWAFAGGNHRFGWASHLALSQLPILARKGEVAQLAAVAPSLVVAAP